MEFERLEFDVKQKRRDAIFVGMMLLSPTLFVLFGQLFYGLENVYSSIIVSVVIGALLVLVFQPDIKEKRCDRLIITSDSIVFINHQVETKRYFKHLNIIDIRELSSTTELFLHFENEKVIELVGYSDMDQITERILAFSNKERTNVWRNPSPDKATP
ncbi:hypothetical protein [Pleionea sp. CnH1-48]|uniref:hypothetical protein n=1 Tax=Pleionea sp. CnH1-48 TaxID=2954494 RepID=UPI002097257A|nr:hypothetical protein [Pleionea sp. CnH1-48]MCO7226021.1 hypothetical protein [Pleionea sp. CnH1-48]